MAGNLPGLINERITSNATIALTTMMTTKVRNRPPQYAAAEFHAQHRIMKFGLTHADHLSPDKFRA
jgi:hypothetical protein